jgi:glyoxylase-like metal-dependent hydrolase (beta-lactamase superfamily II)
MALHIESFEAGPVATVGYLVIDTDTRQAVIIDAPMESAERFAAALDAVGATPGALILTHTHWDHTGDVAELKRRYPGMLIYVHPDDEYRLENPMEHSVWKLPFVIEGAKADSYLRHGDTFTLDGITLNVIHTPGHTEGGICLYAPNDGVIFVGDTLFEGSVGRTDLPGGSWNTLATSITEQLMTLPDEVRVYPGHGPATTIGFERVSNPFVGNISG